MDGLDGVFDVTKGFSKVSLCYGWFRGENGAGEGRNEVLVGASFRDVSVEERTGSRLR